MGSILAYRYTSTETLSAIIAMRETLQDKHSDNPFIVLLIEKLQILEEKLRASIAFHDKDNQSSESDAVDIQFNESFKKLRSMVELYSEMDEFGDVAQKCAEIRDVIHRHGRDLHDKPKDEQISLFDSVIEEIPAETVDAANIRPLFDPVVTFHNNLKDLEKARRAAVANSESISSPTDIAKQIKPLLTKLHNHITDFAELGEENYTATVTTINAKLAPIVTRVKTRKTKSENEIN